MSIEGDETWSASDLSMSFMRQLYRITKHYTAAAEAIPHPREIDLDTLTIVGGEDSELESYYCQRSSASEWADVTAEEIRREFDNYPEHIIPKDEIKEREMRQQYLDCVNRTATLLQDIESEGDSSDDIPNDELFDISIDRPVKIHRSFPANSPTGDAPEDDIGLFANAIAQQPKLKQDTRWQSLVQINDRGKNSPRPANGQLKRNGQKQPHASLVDMTAELESPRKKRKTK